MGNAHGGSGTSADSHSSGTNGIAAHYVKRKQRLAELHNLRRRSVPAEGIFVTGGTHKHLTSFTYGQTSPKDLRSGTPPRIQINGHEPSTDDSITAESDTCMKPHQKVEKVDSRKVVRKRMAAKSATVRRMEFLSFGANFAARSLDDYMHDSTTFEIDLRPLSTRTRSLSPLKQMRTYSQRSLPSEESVLNEEVRNICDLETEIAPALFTYGKRHYQDKLLSAFNEESVRLFCGQVICTMLDLLGSEMTSRCLEAWIEMMRFLGRALFNGFEYERLARTKTIAINTKDHAYFL
ncbi:Protein GLB-23 [Aphelenchoides avenae]|nr:Protein GLB-23 [Aphelenchus avenae]